MYTDDEGKEYETTMFAQRLSEKYHNITVVGADGDVMYGTAEDGKPGIVGVNRPNDNKDGEFITFSKGKKVASRKANYTGEKTEYGPKKFFNHQ